MIKGEKLKERLKTNSLKIRVPALCEEWDYEKNGGLLPENVLFGSCKKVWWICKKCNFEWEAIIYSRSNGSGCGSCAGKYPTAENNLHVLYPEICEDWNYEKNEKNPHEYAPKSSKVVWWKCSKCEHEWKSAIDNRTDKEKRCGVCSGRKASYNNNLKSDFPEVAKEWNYRLNKDLTPENVRPKARRKAWWLCSKCSHEWEAAIYSRTVGRSCPICKIKSNGENIILSILNRKGVGYIREYSFPDCKNKLPLRFDFAIMNNTSGELVFLIEYDGRQHFESHSTFGGEKEFLKRVENDKIKNEYCKTNNIKLVRIPFWKMRDIKSILNNHLGDEKG